MMEDLVPMVVMTGMFAMIFGIVYIRSRENMAMIEKGLNPRQRKATPRPFVSLKYGLLLIGSGLGLLFAYIIDHTIIDHSKPTTHNSITIGGHHSKGRNQLIIVSDTGRKTTDTSLTFGKSDNTNNDNFEDDHSITEIKSGESEGVPIYFALIAIGGGLGLFFSYRIEKKEWLDKKREE